MNDRKPERRGLGRGLSALMADVLPAETGDPSTAPKAALTLPVERIVANPDQPRKTFAPEALRELADSIRQHGIIQPLVVRVLGDTGLYQIVAGERRWRAAQIAQLDQVPVVVRAFTDAEVAQVALIENIQRADLNAIEEAYAYRQLMDRFGHTQEKLAEALSRSRSHVANLMRLLTLPEAVQEMVRTGDLAPGHARALVGRPEATQLARLIVSKGLSVREAEKLAKRDAGPVRTGPRGAPGSEKDADTRALETDLSAHLNMLVRIDHAPGGEFGHLSIRYRSLDDLDLLCQVLSAIPRDYPI